MNDWVYGIDLGTTYSAVTYVHPRTEEVQELIRLEENDFTLPSVVLFLPGHRVKVGQSAIESSGQKGSRLVMFVKRSIGLLKTSEFSWPIVFEGHEYYSEDVSALILRKIAKVIASPDLGLPPARQVVVTHPQYFWSNQKEATRQACELAGLEPIATLTEPHAAAIAYGVYETAERERRDLNVMIFDLGGGTLDVTIMHVSPQVMEVLASDGDARLGGIDWNRILADWVKESLRNRGVDVDTEMIPEQVIELESRIERAKRTLSSRDEATLILEIGDHRSKLIITRSEFEALSQPLVQRCLDRCQQAVQKAGLRWEDIDRILLVGSSTQMPMIPDALERKFNRPIQRLRDPKGVVAKGAALWGYWLQKGMVHTEVLREEGSTEEVTGIALPEVKGATAHGIGVLVEQAPQSPWIDILIPANTPTPCEVEKTYVTARDYATRLEVPLYESDSSRPEEGACVRIGTIVIDGLPPRPKGQPVKVFLKIDVSGLLTVEVIDQDTGRRVQKQIDRRELAQGLPQRLSLAERKAHLDRLIVED